MTRISRRRFCKAVGAGTLAWSLPTAVLADQLSTRRVKVFGIGGTGYDVVHLLREQLSAESNVTTRTVKWSPNSPHSVDLDFAPSFDREPLPPELLSIIAGEVSGSDLVVLVTGFASRRAANLTYEFARAAKESGAKVVSALVVAYPSVWSDLPSALRAAPRIIEISDRAECIDASSVGVAFPPVQSIGSAIDRMNIATADLVKSEIVPACPTSPREAGVGGNQLPPVPFP